MVLRIVTSRSQCPILAVFVVSVGIVPGTDNNDHPLQSGLCREIIITVIKEGGGLPMPPHCDTLDGPVVTVAREALEKKDVKIILPYVPKEAEEEIITVFKQVIQVRNVNSVAQEVADRYFFETVVRLHRAGEGASFTGLKPAGLDEGPVIPVAERAIESGNPDELLDLLAEMVRKHVRDRFDHMQHLKRDADQGVEQAREYVEAMLGLQVYSHSLYLAMQADPHEGHHEH